MYFSNHLLKLISYLLYICVTKVLIDMQIKQAKSACLDFLLGSDCILLQMIRLIPSVTHTLGCNTAFL